MKKKERGPPPPYRVNKVESLLEKKRKTIKIKKNNYFGVLMSLVYIGKVWQSKSFSLCFEVKERSLGKRLFYIFNSKAKSFF